MSARGLRRGLMITTLVLGVTLLAGPSTADVGVNELSINDVVVPVEGDSGSTNAEFTVTLDPADVDSTVTVNYATSNGSATTGGSDYQSTTGTLTFLPNDTEETISVPVLGDTLDEINETFTVTLSTPTEADIGDGTGTGTITDDDDPPSASIGPASASEGGNLSFPVTLSSPSGQPVTVNYSTSNDSAVAPGDYDAVASGNIVISSGTTGTITISSNEDALDEANETFDVTLAPSATATVGSPGSATGTINDDDSPPAASIGPASATEGGNLSFPVTLSAASGQPVTVNYSTSNGSAVAPSDYDAVAGGNIVISSGTTGTITISSNEDGLDETAETFTVTLAASATATVGSPGSATGTINDNDAAPSASIGPASATEGGNLSFPVTLSAASGQPVTVNYSTTNGSAVAPGDYDAVGSGSIVIASGTTGTITISSNEDALDEAAEAFTVTLGASATATVGSPGSATGTINDNDPTPTLAISDESVTEGNSGVVFLVFDVNLSAASGQTVTVNYATANNTATAPADYTAIPSTTLTFNPGETTKTVSVLVNGDGADEPNETLHVNLTSPVNATISDSQGVGTIVDDDGPGLSINDVTVNEGAGSATFTVSLGSSSPQPVTVNYATANGTASAPGDYTAIPSTQLTFNAGETTKTVSVSVNADGADEVNETFQVNLSGAVNATISDAQGIGTIVDDDGPTISINNVTTVSETGNAVFTVSLSAPSPQAIQVQFSTAPGSATAGADYTTTNGTLTIPANTASGQITVPILGDTLDEENETFFVNLANPSNANMGDSQGQGTITDDDALPTLSINDLTSANETGTLTFTVTLSAVSGRTVTVNFATADGPAPAAVAPGDYQAQGNLLSFAPGETTKQIVVTINQDSLDEQNEKFSINLTNPSPTATIADAQGIGTITDDDAAPSVSIAPAAAVNEGNPALFTVSLSAASGQQVIVQYTTTNGTATAPADFTAPPAGSTVVFAPGETSKQISVSTIDDSLDEAETETFTATISAPANATLGTATATGTISDNDALPALTINDASGFEGNSQALGSCSPVPPAGTTPTGCAHFTVSLATASGRAVTVQYSSAIGTASSPADFAAVGPATLTFVPGASLTQIVSVPIFGDVSDEPNETFSVNLASPSNATITDATGVGTILDDDGTPTLTVTGAQGLEGNPEAGLVVVALSPASGVPVTVGFSTANGSAVAGVDYKSIPPAVSPCSGAAGGSSCVLSFSPGQTNKAITVSFMDDAIDEDDEFLTVNLSNEQNAIILSGQDRTGVVTIRDDDPAPSVSIGDVTVTEGNGGAVSASFPVTLSAASGRSISVNYATVNGSAVAPDDYATSSGSLSFAPGETTKTAVVPVNGDGAVEGNETFLVNLSTPVNVGIGDGQAVGTIVNDDANSSGPGPGGGGTTPPPPPGPPTPDQPPPPPPPRPPPPPPVRTFSGMSVPKKPVTLFENLAPITVKCPRTATRRCIGSVALQGQARALSIVNGRPTAKAVTLGREQFSIPRGRSETILVSLSRRAMRAVNRKGKLSVTVVVTARDAAGRRAKPFRRSLLLKSPRVVKLPGLFKSRG